MAVHHHDEGGGGSGVNALAILAILAIVAAVGLAIWFFVVRSGGVPVSERGVDIDVKIDSSATELVLQHVA